MLFSADTAFPNLLPRHWQLQTCVPFGVERARPGRARVRQKGQSRAHTPCQDAWASVDEQWGNSDKFESRTDVIRHALDGRLTSRGKMKNPKENTMAGGGRGGSGVRPGQRGRRAIGQQELR